MNELPKEASEILHDGFEKANKEKPVSEWIKEENGQSLDPQIRTIDLIRRTGLTTDTQP